VSHQLDIIEIPITQHFHTLEICCFDVLCKTKRFRIFSVYRQPYYDSTSVEYTAELVARFSKFTKTKYPCIIAGDLNGPDIYWANSFSPSDNVQDKLLHCSVGHGFVQLVPKPTRLGNTLGF
jgi:hypothetical protein